ncbi:MAG: sporulation protein YunB [Clostridia bacterium]|nr:sporulation protein YunB [Clostridia bacterium]
MRSRKSGNRWLKRLIVLGLVPILALFLLDYHLRPVMLANASGRAKELAMLAINRAVEQTLVDLAVDYDNFITVTRDGTGQITAISANAAPINRVKAAVNVAVSAALHDTEPQEFFVPLGTLSGVALLSGRGPQIGCRTMVVDTPIIDLESSLSSAGINQTLHRIDLKVTVPLVVTLPMQTNTVSVQTDYLLAQTVLLGDVPDSYTDVISDPDMVGSIFDYADVG